MYCKVDNNLFCDKCLFEEKHNLHMKDIIQISELSWKFIQKIAEIKRYVVGETKKIRKIFKVFL